MHTGISQMFIQTCFAFVVLATLAAIETDAVSGSMALRVSDSRTSYPVQAVINGEGPKAFSATTDRKGYLKMVLPVGEYHLQISAPGHAVMKTHNVVQQGRVTSFGIMLDSETVPEEESQAVLDSMWRPGCTLLHEYVVDAKTGQPLPGVTVRLVNAGVETKTDSKGHYYLLSPTPKPEFPGSMGTDTLIYKKAGYKTLIFRNSGLVADEMGGGSIGLERGRGAIDRDATHKLMRR
jgi:hypothetical protein